MATTKLGLIRFNNRRKEKYDIQLTALIDIIVFLLVFLIQVVTISKLNLTLQGDIVLPSSKSVDSANRAITVQITRNLDVYIENEKITLNPGPLWSDSNMKIIAQRLQQIKVDLNNVIEKSNNTERFNLVINLAMDKSLEYSNIKNLMDLSSALGLIQFKFIVSE